MRPKLSWFFFPQIFSNLSLPTSGDSCELSPQCCPFQKHSSGNIYSLPSSPAASLPMATGGAGIGKFVFQELLLSLQLEEGQVAAVDFCPPGAGAGPPSWLVPLTPKYPDLGCFPQTQTARHCCHFPQPIPRGGGRRFPLFLPCSN